MLNPLELRTKADGLFAEAKELVQKTGTPEEVRTALDSAKAKKTEAIALNEQADEIEDLNKRSVDAAKRTLPVEVRDNRTDAPWAEGENGFGEFMCAVANASLGRGFDPRLDKRAPSGLQTGIGADGGFAVDKDFVSTIMQRVYQFARLAPRCTQLTIGPNANGVKIPYVDETSRATGSRFGGVRAYWTNQGTSVTASKPKMGSWELDLGKIMAYGHATEEMLQDAAQVASIMLQAFSSEIAFELDDAIYRGDGNGKPKGVIGGPSTVTVAKETAGGAQTADTVLWANVAKMFGRVSPGSITRGSWYINQGVYAQLLLLTSAATAADTPMFVPPGRVADAPFGTLYGRPIEILEQASALGDEGDIAFLDLSEYVLISKGGMRGAESMHVKFDSDEMTYRLVYRVNGYPKWKSVLTPYKGAASISPFVTLAER